MVQYQERWIKGRAVGEKQRDSASRYEVIKGLLSRYNRPFSVLDLGANAGYFAFRIAEDFPHATVIAIDDKAALRECAVLNGYDNVIVIPKRLNGAALAKLAQCERIDAVMALNVLHHIPDWGLALESLKEMAHTLIVETPSAGDRGAANPDRHIPLLNALSGAEKVAEFPAHTTKGEMRPLYCMTCPDAPMTAQSMDVVRGSGPISTADDFKGGDRDAPEMSGNVLERDFDGAAIRIERKKSNEEEHRGFIPGMNLWNFALLGGIWPRKTETLVREEAERLTREGRWMDDLRPWNFILSGGKAHAIDIGWKKWRKEPEEDGLKTCLEILNAPR